MQCPCHVAVSGSADMTRSSHEGFKVIKRHGICLCDPPGTTPSYAGCTLAGKTPHHGLALVRLALRVLTTHRSSFSRHCHQSAFVIPEPVKVDPFSLNIFSLKAARWQTFEA